MFSQTTEQIKIPIWKYSQSDAFLLNKSEENFSAKMSGFSLKKGKYKFYIWMCSHAENTNTGIPYHFSTIFCAGAN